MLFTSLTFNIPSVKNAWFPEDDNVKQNKRMEKQIEDKKQNKKPN